MLLGGTGHEKEMYGDVVLQPKTSETLARLHSPAETKQKQLVGIIQAYPGLFSDNNLIELLMWGDAKPITDKRFYQG